MRHVSLPAIAIALLTLPLPMPGPRSRRVHRVNLDS